MIIGLIGGIGSGKSTITEVLKSEYGFELLLTDDIAKELELPGGCCYEAITDAFGTGILQNGAGSRIDNQKLAARIYGDQEALAKINAIVHPAVWSYVRAFINDRIRHGGIYRNKCNSKASVSAGDDYDVDDDSMNACSNDRSDKAGSASAPAHAPTPTPTPEKAAGREAAEPRIAVETALPDEEFEALCDEIWFIRTDREIRVKRLMENRGYTREKSESIIARQWDDAQFEAAADKIIDNSGNRRAAEAQVRKYLDELSG